MANRLVRWFTFAVAFALMPLGTSLLLHHLHGTSISVALQRSPELLFFSLMICATALGDLTQSSIAIGEDIALRVLSSALLIGAAISAILYGSFLYDQIADPAGVDFRSQLLGIATWMSVIFLTLGTLVQVLIARVEEK